MGLELLSELERTRLIVARQREILVVEYQEDFVPDAPGIYAHSELGLCVIHASFGLPYLLCSYKIHNGFAMQQTALDGMHGGLWSFKLETM